MMLIDTEIEKRINLGTTYPFPPQKEGECLISHAYGALTGSKKGSLVSLNLPLGHLLDAIIDQYNLVSEGERIAPISGATVVTIPCTVSNLTDGSYAKYPEYSG